jgi:hypothetical protein
MTLLRMSQHAREGMGMPPEIVDAASRALVIGRSRRGAFGAFLAVGMVASMTGESLSRRRKKKNKDKHKSRNKNGNKDKSSSVGSCTFHNSEQEILSFISAAAKKYGQSENAMVRVARCESVLDPCAVNRSGPYYGLFQFLKSTWSTTPFGDRDIFDPEAQALAAGWMWQQGRKNEWACQ